MYTQLIKLEYHGGAAGGGAGGIQPTRERGGTKKEEELGRMKSNERKAEQPELDGAVEREGTSETGAGGRD